jgi:DDE family transposase
MGAAPEAAKPACKKKGRPKKREQPPAAEPTRLERQAGMTREELLADLPRECNAGSKKNSKGYVETWVGCKLHAHVADGQIPISCILASASLHDSQAAIPLAELSARRVTNLYDLMDSAYDAEPLRKYSRSLGHVPIIDANPRRDAARKAELPAEEKLRQLPGCETSEDVRFHERTTAILDIDGPASATG